MPSIVPGSVNPEESNGLDPELTKMLMGGLGGLSAFFDARRYNKIADSARQYLAGREKAARARFGMADGGWMKDPLGWQAAIDRKLERQMENMPEGYGVEAPSFSGYLRYLMSPLSGLTPLRQIPPRPIEVPVEAPPTIIDVLKTNANEKKKALTYAQGGALGLLRGGSPGQSDRIPAMLSDGEYVMDADTVSALGDGNNAAGAGALDKMRQNIRAHKRSAPVTKIPPKAKNPMAYLKKGAA
jgi:hypothetical protein